MPINATLPLTWDEADTITDVIARQTEAGNTGEIKACGAFRLATYYRMPIINFLMKWRGLSYDEADDITQGFILHLESPLLSGDHVGFARKIAIRRTFVRDKKAFRAYLATCVKNYFNSWASERGGEVSSTRHCENNEEFDRLVAQSPVVVQEADLATDMTDDDWRKRCVSRGRDVFEMFAMAKAEDGAKVAQRIRTLRLFFIEGKTQVEIAAEFGATDRTVRNHLEDIVPEFQSWLMALVHGRIPLLAGHCDKDNYIEELESITRLFDRMDKAKRMQMWMLLGKIGDFIAHSHNPKRAE